MEAEGSISKSGLGLKCWQKRNGGPVFELVYPALQVSDIFPLQADSDPRAGG